MTRSLGFPRSRGGATVVIRSVSLLSARAPHARVAVRHQPQSQGSWVSGRAPVRARHPWGAEPRVARGRDSRAHSRSTARSATARVAGRPRRRLPGQQGNGRQRGWRPHLIVQNTHCRSFRWAFRSASRKWCAAARQTHHHGVFCWGGMLSGVWLWVVVAAEQCCHPSSRRSRQYSVARAARTRATTQSASAVACPTS